MTKDWEAVQDEIRELSFAQKKPLEEVKELMEQKYKFRASYVFFSSLGLFHTQELIVIVAHGLIA